MFVERENEILMKKNYCFSREWVGARETLSRATQFNSFSFAFLSRHFMILIWIMEALIAGA